MDAVQWQQQVAIGLERTMEDQISPAPNNSNNPTNSGEPILERRARPQKDQNLNCPRCNSTNTKFCYYNNYSLSQPRYFCKTCRRYWTQGGSLRNVPVGGGSRKNKKPSSSSSSPSMLASSSTTPSSPTPTIPTKLIPDLNPPNPFSHLLTSSQNPNKFLEGQDLNLAFPIQGIFQPLEHQVLPKIEGTNNNNNDNQNPHDPVNMNGNNLPTTTSTCTPTSSRGGDNNNSAQLSALELLRTAGIASRGSLNPYPMPMPDNSNTLYPSSGFPNLQEFKPNMGVFSSHHQGNDNHMIGSGASGGGGGARLLFPFADMNKLASSTTIGTAAQHHDNMADQNKGGNDHHLHNNHHHQGTTGYWTGMLGGGTW